MTLISSNIPHRRENSADTNTPPPSRHRRVKSNQDLLLTQNPVTEFKKNSLLGPEDKNNFPPHWKKRSMSSPGSQLISEENGNDRSSRACPARRDSPIQYNPDNDDIQYRLRAIEQKMSSLAVQVDQLKSSQNCEYNNNKRVKSPHTISNSMINSPSITNKNHLSSPCTLPFGILDEEQIRSKGTPFLLSEKVQNKCISTHPPQNLMINTAEGDLGGKLLEIQEFLINACIGYHNWSSQLVHFLGPSLRFLKASLNSALPWPQSCQLVMQCSAYTRIDLAAMRIIHLVQMYPNEGESLQNFLKRYQVMAYGLEGLFTDSQQQLVLNFILNRYDGLKNTVNSVRSKSRNMEEFYKAYLYLSPLDFIFPIPPSLSRVEGLMIEGN